MNTVAGLDLRYNKTTVTETALKYGYESPVSFARAFQAFHEINPSEAKKSNGSLKIFPRLIFQIIVKEVSRNCLAGYDVNKRGYALAIKKTYTRCLFSRRYNTTLKFLRNFCPPAP